MTRFFCRCACLWIFATGVLADNFNPWTETATYQVNYAIDLAALPNREEVRVWVPLCTPSAPM
ncbi:MAG: hypothetical protein QGH93_00905, partial [Gammaproteobacteria bacterium]|nr:hypothetical protein [Gammaproteobacteria bacterium]